MAKNIVFLGIKHCGKSTQAELLAQRLQREFLDSDELLVEAYRRQYPEAGSEVSPRMIMQKHGGEFFRQFEAQVIRNFLQDNPGGKVLALGGGVPVNSFLSFEELKQLGVLVYLDVDMETAYRRIAAGGIPPFLAGDDPHGKFQALFAERTPCYRKLADLHIVIEQEGPAEVLNDLIFDKLRENKLLDI